MGSSQKASAAVYMPTAAALLLHYVFRTKSLGKMYKILRKNYLLTYLLTYLLLWRDEAPRDETLRKFSESLRKSTESRRESTEPRRRLGSVDALWICVEIP